MSKEEFAGQEPEAKKLSPEVRRSLDSFRGKFIRALILTGALSAIEACGGLTEEEVHQLPKATIGEISKDAKKFAELPMIRTDGYPSFNHRDRETSWIYVYKQGLQQVYKTKDFYTLYEGPGKTSNTIEMYIDKGQEMLIAHGFGNVAADVLERKLTTHKDHRYRIVGQMKKIGDGKYAIEVAESLDLDQPAEKSTDKNK